MSTQPGAGAGAQPQHAAALLPPRFQDEGNVSMHANHGYNNQTKPPVQADQAQQRPEKKPSNTQRQLPNQGAPQNIKVLRPGPGDQNPNQGAAKNVGARAPLP